MTKRNITTSLKLPFHFDLDLLNKDLNSLMTSSWKAHFNTDGYAGEWTSIALYAPGGNASDIRAMVEEHTEFEATPIMEHCAYFKEVIKTFQCPLKSVRLLRLGVGAEIKPHKDYNLGYENNCFRLHVPIVTSADVDFILDGHRLEMRPGECWYTNVNYTHSVYNKGMIDRVHLVIDGDRNAWSDELFFSLAPQESFFPVIQDNHSPELLKQMIRELELMDDPNVLPLINKFKQQLQEDN